MNVVLDTNILISALFWRGTPYRVVLSALQGKYSLCLSRSILLELEEKLKLKFKFPQSKIKDLLTILSSYSIIVKPSKKLHVITEDPDDNKILECAIACKAKYIISGDRHLLHLKQYKGIRIISANEFLKLL